MKAWTRQSVADLAFKYACLTRLSDCEPGLKVGKDPEPVSDSASSLVEHLRALSRARAESLPFGDVEHPRADLVDTLQSRRSRRNVNRASPPITKNQIFSLLDLAIGVTSPEAGLRSYPSASGIYEIETCLIARRTDLQSGLWHVDIENSQLSPLRSPIKALKEVVTIAAWATGSPAPADMILLFYVDLGKIDAAYSALGLSLTLKHIGAMTQNVYLVCEALGLGACALGSGSLKAENQVIESPPESKFLCLGAVAINARESNDEHY